jgi:DNA-binding PadR family transcriptional regulator
VLGLLDAYGPATPYDLKRHVTATIGHFWSFPHALLYKEPARLTELGLLTEERESGGRRRRLFSITTVGRQALRAWLARPSQETTELRDLGLLQLFFADLEPATTVSIAKEQHTPCPRRWPRTRQGGPLPHPGSRSPSPTVEQWRG